MVEKIVSGGQTGVDRAALDFALETGLSCGGWCPKGRLAEDGPIDLHYPLEENSSTDYSVRTRQNVLDSDGTLILNMGPLSGGTAYTEDSALAAGRPCLIVALDQDPDPDDARKWLDREGIQTLNVAGPRASKQVGIYQAAQDFLGVLFSQR